VQSRVILRKPQVRVVKDMPDDLYGLANQKDFEIEINKNQDSRELANTYLHESLHCYLPDLNERNIEKMAALLTDGLWKLGYRRIAK
jgi:hypothetical protein